MNKKIGIGIDIVDINNFSKKPYQENRSFYKKIFDNSEIKHCTKYKDPYPHFAVKFALKEATIKAINKKIILRNIITYYSLSKPQIRIKNIKNEYGFIVSASHEKNYAIGIVISESRM